MRKGIWPALLVAMLLAFAPGASAATVRHASPASGSTGACTAAEPPCSLKRAVETVAVAGDEVVLAPGLYEPPSGVGISKAIYVHGQAGEARPRVVRSSGVVFSVTGGGTLADVQLEAPGAVLTLGSVAERVIVLSGPEPATSPATEAVRVNDGGVLRDSLVRTEATGAHAVHAAYGVVHLVNVTALATDAGGSALYGDPGVGQICVPDSRIELHAANVIARGGLYDVSVPHVCGGLPNAPPSETAYMTHSNSAWRS